MTNYQSLQKYSIGNCNYLNNPPMGNQDGKTTNILKKPLGIFIVSKNTLLRKCEPNYHYLKHTPLGNHGGKIAKIVFLNLKRVVILDLSNGSNVIFFTKILFRVKILTFRFGCSQVLNASVE